MTARLRESAEKINRERCGASKLSFDCELAPLCTFRIGGKADIAAWPSTQEGLLALCRWAREESVPVTVLGGGANVLVADAGIRGITIFTTALTESTLAWNEDGTAALVSDAGLPISDLSARAADQGAGGLEFIYSMPGSVGGAVFMNARCYGSEISEVLRSVDYLDENLEPRRYLPVPGDFQYKNTPFMHRPWIILRAEFALRRGNRAASWEKMRELEADRTQKGHFAAPSAGSMFKNNQAFGAPSGKIIDELGLRATSVGDAQISPLHANIFVNRGNARAEDMLKLILHVRAKVFEARGYLLEPEVEIVGDWPESALMALENKPTE